MWVQRTPSQGTKWDSAHPQEERTVVWGGNYFITLLGSVVSDNDIVSRVKILWHFISAGWVKIKTQGVKSTRDMGSSSVTGSQEIMSKMTKSRKGTLLRSREGSWVWWCMPVVPATWGAEAGGSVESRSSGLYAELWHKMMSWTQGSPGLLEGPVNLSGQKQTGNVRRDTIKMRLKL